MADHQEEDSPCFSWYPSDWRGSRHVRMMSWKERGLYRECLDWAWDLNGLPSDLEEIRRTIGASSADFTKTWPAIVVMFSLWPDNRFRNERQEKERDKQRVRRQRGQDGGKAKAASRAEVKQPVSSPQVASQLGIGSTSHSHTLVHSHTHALVQAAAPPAGGSKRPIFSGQRFTVFEWQLENLERLLGAHFEAFDLHAWFFELDERSVKSAQLVPQRDNGAWLLAQTETEAKRRGLVGPVRDYEAEHQAEGEALLKALREGDARDKALGIKDGKLV